MRPVDAPAGTFAVIVESEMTVNVVAAIFLNVTAVAPLSPTPLSVTTSPTSPDRGITEVRSLADTTKAPALSAEPLGVVTETGPGSRQPARWPSYLRVGIDAERGRGDPVELHRRGAGEPRTGDSSRRLRPPPTMVRAT